ncbi:MAG: acyl-CoA thioesterase [Woeseiaceae bacterium]
MIRTDFSGCLTASSHFRVPFNDIDVTGVAWHGRYFKYFEDARRSLYERIGYSYEEMLESGYVWPIADTSVRYVRPLTLNQDVRVTACLREWELRLVVDYKVEDADGTICTKARTVQVPLAIESRELRFGSPQVLIDRVNELLARLPEKA